MKSLIIQLYLVCFMFNAIAQKLPGKQKISLRAPIDIKIDGKASEWNNKFQAYNNATDLFYTISNDDKNIYLIVKAEYPDIIDKILRGGITFIINPSSNKKDKNMVSVTYPVLEGPDMWMVSNEFGGMSNAYRKGEAIKVNELNDLFATKEKIITVTGIEEIPDQYISIYNAVGIKSASLFDDKATYTYELALPITYLKIPDNGGSTFKYQVKINMAPAIKRPSVITSTTPPPPPVPTSTLATTDFFGEYTLAKK